MGSRKPILIFDTSVINLLMAERDFPALAAGLSSAYATRLTGSNISELVATSNAEKRERLLDTCQRLLSSGDCIDAFNWIVERHIKAFDQNPERYDWRSVNIRSREIEQEIVRRAIIDDELARLEKESATETKALFDDIFCSMRPGFDSIFANGTERPATFADFVKILQKPGGAFYAGYARKFYERNVTEIPDETKLRAFSRRCPSFLMMVLSSVMAQYKRVIVETPRRKKRAGCVDLLMAVYLPYCRIFVTNDDDQEASLREMAAVADLEAEILAYREFRNRLVTLR